MSSIKLIQAYLRERYPIRVFLPFAILITVTGSAAQGSLPTIRDAMIACVLAYSLVLVFRIVDDLADLSSDRLSHPTRVLVQATTPTPIVGLALLIAVVAILIVLSQSRPGIRLTVFGLLSLLLLVWYLLRERLRVGPLISAHVILVKYPVICLLTCTDWSELTLANALPACLTLYLGVCIYEQVHDRRVRESRGGAWIFAAEVGLLVCIPILLFSTGGFLRW